MTSLPTAASSAILERDGRFLLVRRRNPPSADMYAFPGGRAEAGETPAETACASSRKRPASAAQSASVRDLRPEDAARCRRGQLASHFFLSVFRVEADGSLPSLPTMRPISAGTRSTKSAASRAPRACGNAWSGWRGPANKQGEIQRKTLFPSSSGYPTRAMIPVRRDRSCLLLLCAGSALPRRRAPRAKAPTLTTVAPKPAVPYDDKPAAPRRGAGIRALSTGRSASGSKRRGVAPIGCSNCLIRKRKTKPQRKEKADGGLQSRLPRLRLRLYRLHAGGDHGRRALP
jgi:ADP-ribose pyrophosphatase YjhB (NUDIX family)